MGVPPTFIIMLKWLVSQNVSHEPEKDPVTGQRREEGEERVRKGRGERRE